VTLETGATPGAYFYTRDHLDSIRELTDSTGSIRARYSYDSFGRPTYLSGDLNTDFGFAGMFYPAELSLNLTKFRAYDPDTGRWLSRDVLANAEFEEGTNLYAYVLNDPVNKKDPMGLAQGQGDGPTIADAARAAKANCTPQCPKGATAKYSLATCWKSGTQFSTGWTCIVQCSCSMPIACA
jgi:RHS repeat-associated protein